MNKTKNLTYGALLIVLGIVTPMIFHTFNMGGKIFLPMHLPVLIAGLLLDPLYALLVGVLTPVLSSILTSMPPIMPMLPIMVFELGTYGLVGALIKNKAKQSDIVSLICAMISGRIIAGIIVYFMISLFSVKLPAPHLFISSGVITGLPGIVIQIILIPILMAALRRARVIERYERT